MDCSAKCEMPGQVLLHSAPSPVCADSRTLPNSLQPGRILPKFDRNTALLAAADVVCDLWMVKL